MVLKSVYVYDYNTKFLMQTMAIRHSVARFIQNPLNGDVLQLSHGFSVVCSSISSKQFQGQPNAIISIKLKN